MSDVTYNASGIAIARACRSLWYRATRPFSFTASIIPVLVGSGLRAAGGRASRRWRSCSAWSAAVALQAGTNLVNDYYDRQLGADHSGSLGPSRVIQEGWLSPRDGPGRRDRLLRARRDRPASP